MGSTEEYLRNYICKYCPMFIMKPHPELHGWIKCTVCSYSKKIEDNDKIDSSERYPPKKD